MIGGMSGRRISPIVVGRQRELDLVDHRFDATLAGRAVHLVVTGEAGIGKSRLAEDVAARAADRGMRVLRGSCASSGTGGVPYGPLVDVLRGAMRDLPQEMLDDAVGPSGVDLARLVPTLGPAPVTVEGMDTQSLKGRLLEGLLGFLQRLAASGPVLVIIEDLHWADPASRDAVAFLLRNLQADPVQLVVTVRTDDLHRNHPLLPWLAELERSGRVERIELARLDPGQTAEMLAAITGVPPDPALVERIHARADGNPFFIEELSLTGDAVPGLARLSPTLRDILLARIAAAPDRAQAVIDVAAVAGRRVDHDLLAAVAALDEADLMDGIRSAVSARLLVAEAEPDSPEAYAFRHALVQEAAYDELLPSERRRLHLAFAEALSTRGPGSGSSFAGYWSELAYHWSAARDEPRAFAAAVRAGEAAEATFAFADARRHFEQALEAWSAVPDPAALAGMDRVTLLARAAQAAWLAGDARRAVAWLRAAVADLDPQVEPVRSAELLSDLGHALWNMGDSAALATCEQAVAMMPTDRPIAARARVLAGYGQLLMLVDRCRESLVACEAAIEIARAVGARQFEGHALNTRGLDLAAEGRYAEAVESLTAALEIAREVANADDIGRAYVNTSEILARCGRLDEAAAVIEEGIAVADAVGIASTYGRFIRSDGVQIAFDRGAIDDARRLMVERLAADPNAIQARRYALARYVGTLVALGDESAAPTLQELARSLEGAPIEAQFHAWYWLAQMESDLWAGRPAAALALAQAALRALADNEWTWCRIRVTRVGMAAAADVAELARARRDPAGAAAAIRIGEAMAEAVAATLEVARDPTAEPGTDLLGDETDAEATTIRAELARLRGEPGSMAWHEAADRWRGVGRPYPEALAGYREAEAALIGGDRVTAVVALAAAERIAERLGTMPLRAAIASLATRARLDLTSEGAGPLAAPLDGGPETDAGEDPFGLTTREREVLGQLVQGRTNRQIATSLFISESTAGVHVSNVIGKLGVANRTEAAAIGARLGIGGPD
jgi:DNA-binding CsgD family transcriptional regulator/tetratricopeptide (TPR) repeat protein